MFSPFHASTNGYHARCFVFRFSIDHALLACTFFLDVFLSIAYLLLSNETFGLQDGSGGVFNWLCCVAIHERGVLEQPPHTHRITCFPCFSCAVSSHHKSHQKFRLSFKHTLEWIRGLCEISYHKLHRRFSMLLPLSMLQLFGCVLVPAPTDLTSCPPPFVFPRLVLTQAPVPWRSSSLSC
jgi:hypothetical protein